MTDPYDLTPLSVQEGSREIRLLLLEPSEPSDPVRCIMGTCSIDSRPPRFTALSYAWGSSLDSTLISLNEVPFAVGNNLYSFLEEMRSQRQYGMYWIDAICINQASEKEKKHQIQMMRQIYSKAVSVSIWLGRFCQPSYLSHGMKFLAQRGSSSFPKQHKAKFGTEEQAKGVVEICFMSYWRRVWIIQEIMLARECTIWCGNMRTSLDSLWVLLRDVRTWYNYSQGSLLIIPRTLLESSAAIIVFAKAEQRSSFQKARSSEHIMGLLGLYRHQEATNILDRVYAFFGLAHDTEGIKIDYSISPEELALKLLIRAIITMNPNTEIISRRRWLMDTAIILAQTLNLKWSKEEIQFAVTLMDD